MKVKLLKKEAKAPFKKRFGDSAFDVYSCEDKMLLPGERYQFKLGIAVEVSSNYTVMVQERSGMALNHGVFTLGNIIDSNYRGEISAILLNTGAAPYEVKMGDRIAQLLVLPIFNSHVETVDTLSNSDREAQGYGSSGV